MIYFQVCYAIYSRLLQLLLFGHPSLKVLNPQLIYIMLSLNILNALTALPRRKTLTSLL